MGKVPYKDAGARAMKPIIETVHVKEPSTLRSITCVRLQSDILGLEEELQSVTETIDRRVGNGTLEKGS